ncbi:MAG: 30S ribosomal protein S17 [Candidatus Aenigmatarchaeota archaeon]
MTQKQKVNNIGIEGINPPSKFCNDVRCPWHGHIKIRGKLLEGIVVSAKAFKTVTVMREYVVYVPKYERYMRKRSKIKAHLPDCIEVKEGDKVLIGETRPLSKTKHFVVISKI